MCAIAHRGHYAGKAKGVKEGEGIRLLFSPSCQGSGEATAQRPLHPSPVSSGEPPEYLRQLSPQLYQQEALRIAARFDEAVQLAEQAFTEELSKLVSHLTERLSGNEDGNPKVFRDSVVENLREFFEWFRYLNIRSDQQLDELVVQTQRVVRGVEPQQLRDNQALR